MEKIREEPYSRNRACLTSLKTILHDISVYYPLAVESNNIRGPSGFSSERGYFDFLSAKGLHLQVCEAVSGNGEKLLFTATLCSVPGLTSSEDVVYVKSCLEKVLGSAE